MKKLKIIEKINILFILIVLVLIVIFSLISFLNSKKVEKESEIEKTTTKFNYNLYKEDTEIYKEEFNNLVKILDEDNIDYEKYAISVSKLFIIDFYTLFNKKSSYDVGGIQFIHSDLKDNFVLNASNTVYKYISNIKDEKPKVKNISVNSVEETEYEYNKIKYEGYNISLAWEYEKDLGYESKANLILIKDNEQLLIVEKKEL